MKLRLKINDSLLPTRCHPGMAPSATILSTAISSSYFIDLNAVDPFDSISYLRLVRSAVHLEGIGASYVGKVHPLLSNQRPNYYVKIVNTNSFLVCVCLLFVQDRQERILSEKHLAIFADIAGVQLLDGKHRDSRQVSRRFVEILVEPTGRYKTTAIYLEVVQNICKALGLGLLESQSVHDHDAIAAKFRQNRRVPCQPSLLFRHFLAKVSGGLCKSNSAADTLAGSNISDACVSGALLPEQLLVGPCDHTSALCRSSSDALIGVIHNNSLLEKPISDRSAESGLIDLQSVNFLAIRV